MPNPTNKLSRSRRNMRRSHFSLKARNVAKCPKCSEPKLSYYVCKSCGTYKGREVIKVK